MFEDLLVKARRGAADSESLGELARIAIEKGREEDVLPSLSIAARRHADARLWQWTGLLQRALDDHGAALASLAQAARYAPSDASIAHGYARVALEAGIDAVALFDRARRLAPANSEVLLGQAAARLAVGRGEAAADELDDILMQVPMWLQGHRQLAQLRSILGRPEQATASLDRALAEMPRQETLWQALFELQAHSGKFGDLASSAGKHNIICGETALSAEYSAIATAELGELNRAIIFFEGARGATRDRLAIWHIRSLLRSGRIVDAIRKIDEALATDCAPLVWPYAAIAWRLAKDPRAEWLMSDPRLVSTTDLELDVVDLDVLANLLRSLHVAKGQYLDQSVRGGTQTDGPLLSRIDPEIKRVRAVIAEAVRRHIAQLPLRDAAHPSLKYPRDHRIRFAGSWSVRLQDAGHHSNHIHPAGWISSALYISLPRRQPQESEHAGCLALGEPQAELKLNLPATQLIKPQKGRLVLFPSWMWHGTKPFSQGERLTIAFDIAPPH